MIDDGIFDSIAGSLSGYTAGSLILLDGHKIAVDKSKFAELRNTNDALLETRDEQRSARNEERATRDERRITFIDAGNAEVASGSNFSLHFCRVYTGYWQGVVCQERVRKEFFVLAKIVGKDGSLQVVAEILGSSQKFVFDANDRSLQSGLHRVEPSRVCEQVRKIAEISAMTDAAEKLSQGDVILRDGHLDAEATYEKEYYAELIAKCRQKGIALAGLAKTTNAVTDSGENAAALLSRMAPEGCWIYLGRTVNFVKLHLLSRHVFRLDVFNADAKAVAELLMQYSVDAAFPGYPYGLVDADKLARVSNEEASQLRLSFLAKSEGRLSGMLSSKDAHEVLDSL